MWGVRVGQGRWERRDRVILRNEEIGRSEAEERGDIERGKRRRKMKGGESIVKREKLTQILPALRTVTPDMFNVWLSKNYSNVRDFSKKRARGNERERMI